MPSLSRRDLTLMLAAAAVLPGDASAQARPVVTMLGDSITAGYRLPPSLALPAKLQAELDAMKVPALVRGAGVPGDTTASGLGRLDGSVRRDTAVCVVALGANDTARGYPVTLTRNNLEAIINRLKGRGMSVVLAGWVRGSRPGAPPADDFNAIFPTLAERHGLLLYPDLMAGVTREMRLADGVHPNPQGAEVIAKGLAPLVARALAARTQ